MRAIAFSCPGMTRAEITTRSPGRIEICLWSLTAMRESAASGSPWLPVVRMSTFSGGSERSSPASASSEAGRRSAPSCEAMPATETMLRPARWTRRRVSRATSTTCWMRWMCEANVATITRPGAPATIARRAGAERALRGGAPLVLDVRAVGQQREHAARRRAPRSAPRSVARPSTGAGSSLKSPECTISPAGVSIARPTPPGMLCATGTVSTAKGPRAMRSPSPSGTSRARPSRSNSRSFSRTSASVSGVPWIGTSKRSRK